MMISEFRVIKKQKSLTDSRTWTNFPKKKKLITDMKSNKLTSPVANSVH